MNIHCVCPRCGHDGPGDLILGVLYCPVCNHEFGELKVGEE